MQNPPYASPPPTYTCIVCGSPNGATLKQFTRTYTPWWVYITLLAGLIPAAIIALIVQTKHNLHAPICSRCHLRQRLSPVISVIVVLVVIVVLIGGLAYAAAQESWIVGIVCVVVSIAIGVLAATFDRRSFPKYLKLDDKNVVINDPIHGPIVLVAPPPYGQY